MQYHPLSVYVPTFTETLVRTAMKVLLKQPVFTLWALKDAVWAAYHNLLDVFREKLWERV